jgi:hypothetical protein
VLGNHRGRFVWREDGMFTDSSDVGKSKLVTRLVYVDHAGKEVYHTELHTRLQLPDGSWRDAHIDLDEHIYYDVEKKALMPHKMPRAHTVCLLLDGTGNEYDDTVRIQLGTHGSPRTDENLVEHKCRFLD